jgi:hypothetical protein
METMYYCRTCRGLRKHEILFTRKTSGNEGDGILYWNEDYLVVECSGCGTISFVKIYGDSDMYDTDEENGTYEYYTESTIFPFFLDGGIEIIEKYLLPETIKVVYNETIDAFKSKCYILTAGGFRAIIEALCNHLKIKKADLSTRIDLLNEKGHLTINESNRLHSIRFLGNDSLHEMAVPKKEQLLIVLEVINHLLENIFIQDKKIEGRIAVVIDSYDGFISLIRNKISEDKLGKELTITELLGNSRRVIKKNLLNKFEKEFSDEISNGSLDFVKIAAVENGKKNKYRIEKLPEFNW